ncbi:MAG: class I SAM-dependent methyltransferase [Bacteroidales bacterium]|nr:class I SAM-dependent methyltransferase [Bacteroidales bacterium]MBQ6184765.1 class I SAM-dependent methyltransferase [Bacteroidales bacterium]
MATEFPTQEWKDYELLDSGGGMKLEKFGGFVLARPEPKALWDKDMSEEQWGSMTHTRFTPGAGFGKAGKEDSGTWDRLRKMPDQWWIRYRNYFSLRLGLTSFKHVGVFPEQAANWDYIFSQTSRIAASQETRPKVLNLFAYTGAASLAARKAGADVTHLDSVRQVVTWAHENQDRSGLDGIRWVVEDAMKFARREAKRGNVYQGIILDPPAYGHGPDGEKWKLDECLFDLMKDVGKILAPQNSFMVLNLYSNGFSAVLGETVVRQALSLSPDFPLDSGELALRDSFGKVLPLSIFVRLRR